MVTLDKQLTWSNHVDQVRNRAAQRLGRLGPLLIRTGLSIRNAFLLYKQLIPSMMDYVFSIWRSAASTHNRKVQVLKFNCLRIATIALSHNVNRKFMIIWELHSFPATSNIWEFWVKGSWGGNPLIRQVCTFNEWWHRSPKASKEGRVRQACHGFYSKGVITTYWFLPTALTEVFPLIPSQLQDKCRGVTSQEGAKLALFPGMAASRECLYLRRESYLRHDQSGIESQRAFQLQLLPLIRVPIVSYAMVLCPHLRLLPRRETQRKRLLVIV